VSSTLLFSSLCKIFRTNDVISLNSSTIIVFDQSGNLCYHGWRLIDRTFGIPLRYFPLCALSVSALGSLALSLHHSTLSPIFRIFFQVPYPVSPAFVTLAKTPGMWVYSSYFGTTPGGLPRAKCGASVTKSLPYLVTSLSPYSLFSKSLPFNLFADPHPLNLYPAIFTKTARGGPPTLHAPLFTGHCPLSGRLHLAFPSIQEYM